MNFQQKGGKEKKTENKQKNEEETNETNSSRKGILSYIFERDGKSNRSGTSMVYPEFLE